MRWQRLVLTIGATLGLCLALAAPAAAIDARFERALRKLGPIERLEQLCNFTAMQRIRSEHKPFRPDSAVASARSDVRIREHTAEAKGAAFRSRKKWYVLSYTCKAEPDHMAVVSFSYTVGGEIPEEKWVGYGLWQ